MEIALFSIGSFLLGCLVTSWIIKQRTLLLAALEKHVMPFEDYHPAILDLYEALNDALHREKKTLKYTVDEIPSNIFPLVYHGLEHLGFTMDLQSDKRKSEFIIFDLTKYEGPRHKDLDPLLKDITRQEADYSPAPNYEGSGALKFNEPKVFIKIPTKTPKVYQIDNVIKVDFASRSKR